MKSLFNFDKLYRKQSSVVPNHVGPVKQLWLKAVFCVGLSCLFILNANGSVNTLETMRGSNRMSKQGLLSSVIDPGAEAAKSFMRLTDAAEAVQKKASDAQNAAQNAANRAAQAAQAGDIAAAQAAATEAQNTANIAAQAAKTAAQFQAGHRHIPAYGEQETAVLQTAVNVTAQAAREAQAAANRAAQAVQEAQNAQNAANTNTQTTNTGIDNPLASVTLTPQPAPYTQGGGGPIYQSTQTTQSCKQNGSLCLSGGECCSGNCDNNTSKCTDGPP